ncbi:unknown protein encoded in prophage CP-933I [Escherichia coli O157:H7 str. EDL933]|uniref:Uncharacterized protein n=1 Tax=Escherichia coli O157:H7 TaxID=83334 RepID=Q8X3M5_ECO57|nr:unknown protein encoded in prophage CP-933I [Escherichia coli O157:H7 str. EDL933]
MGAILFSDNGML